MSMHASKIAFVFDGTTVIVGADSPERLMAYSRLCAARVSNLSIQISDLVL